MGGLVNVAGAGAVQGGMELGGNLAMQGLGKMAKGVMHGYIKPSTAKNLIGKADDIVETALNEAIPVTQGGIEKATRQISHLRDDVTAILRNRENIALQSGTQPDLHAIAEEVRAHALQKYYKPGQDVADFDAAMRVADSIDAHPSLGIPPGTAPGPMKVTLGTADEVKQGLWNRFVGLCGCREGRWTRDETSHRARGAGRGAVERSRVEVAGCRESY